MKATGASCARCFNDRFGRSGHRSRTASTAGRCGARPKLTEEQALQTAKEAVGGEQIFRLKGLSRPEGDAALASLKTKGLTARQIMRVTGVSLGVISRVR